MEFEARETCLAPIFQFFELLLIRGFSVTPITAPTLKS
jgi:hypothetical protein